MKIIVYILTGLAFILICISFISIKIKIIIIKNESEDVIRIVLNTLFGLIKYEASIPYADIIASLDEVSSLKVNYKVKSEEDTKIKEKKKITMEDAERKYMQFKKYKTILYEPLVNLLTKKLRFTQFQWRTDIGCKDAAVTGLLSGILWMFKGQVISFLKNIFIYDELDVKIVPQFNVLVFKTNLNCIMHIKIGYIITTSIKIVYLLLIKGGAFSDKSSNRGLNENNDGKSKGYG